MSKEMIEQAIQDAKDAKDRAKAEKAYNDASTTPPKPALPVKKMAIGGNVMGRMADPSRMRSAAKGLAAPNIPMNAASGRPMQRVLPMPGMKSGGGVSASKRADGIAERGKTRGKMV